MFEFIRYIQPGSYYFLMAQMPQSILCYDENSNDRIGYRLEISEKLDRAYYNLQIGAIPQNLAGRHKMQDEHVVDVFDNYIFLRRYFSKTQILMVLFLRLLSFKNPFYELYCFFMTMGHKRLVIRAKVYDEYMRFASDLVKEEPLISVIIPTLNRYEYLKKVLIDLEKQDYTNFEILICDQSEPFDSNFYEGWRLNIQVIRQEEKALWKARNTCIRSARGEYIALSEDDVLIPCDWLTNHLKCLDFFQVDISAGVFYRNNGVVKTDSVGKCQFRLSTQFPSGNSFLRKSVFKSVGLFDRQFEKQRMGDGEFGLRALLNGYVIITNPMAYIIDIKAPTGGLRQMGSWDALRPTTLFSPRPIPSVLYLIRKYYGSKEAKLYIIKNIPQSFVPYKKKGNKKILMLVYLLIPFWFPLAFVAVWKSWSNASVKLREGAKIGFI